MPLKHLQMGYTHTTFLTVHDLVIQVKSTNSVVLMIVNILWSKLIMIKIFVSHLIHCVSVDK